MPISQRGPCRALSCKVVVSLEEEERRQLETLMRQLPGDKSNDHLAEGGAYWQGGPGWIRWRCWFVGLLSRPYGPWSLGFKSHKTLDESARRGPSLSLLAISCD